MIDLKAKAKQPQARIEKIEIERLDDDISKIQQDEGATKERIDSFGKTWEYIGIRAKAEVSYPETHVYPERSRRLEWFTSGGLWGIESDMDEKDMQEIEKEQLYDLKRHLQVFNIDVKDFEQKIKR